MNLSILLVTARITKKEKNSGQAFRFHHNVLRLRKTLLEQLTHKNSTTEELLGFQKLHRKLNAPEPTSVTIDLDHIRPLASFNLTVPHQLKEAAHYSNIQPLLKHDNHKKGSSYHEHDLAVRNEKLYE